MSGTDRHTGRPVGDLAHLAQSIAVILLTPIGARVLRRDFGSDLPRLIDAPINGETAVDLYQATAEALDRWEPRFDLRRVQIAEAREGVVDLHLTGNLAGEETDLTVALEAAA